jgi:hypothetical protein
MYIHHTCTVHHYPVTQRLKTRSRELQLSLQPPLAVIPSFLQLRLEHPGLKSLILVNWLCRRTSLEVGLCLRLPSSLTAASNWWTVIPIRSFCCKGAWEMKFLAFQRAQHEKRCMLSADHMYLGPGAKVADR